MTIESVTEQNYGAVHINSTVFKMGWAPVSNKMPGCHPANSLKKSFETHSSGAVLYRNEISVHSYIHI